MSASRYVTIESSGDDELNFVSVTARLIQEDEDAEGQSSNGFSFRGRPARMPGLRPGRWELIATPNDNGDGEPVPSEPLLVDLLPGEEREVTITLP